MAPREQDFAEGFLRSFALPLVSGGTVLVGAPLGRRGLMRLLAAAAGGALDGGEPGQALAAARQAVAQEVLRDAELPWLGEDPDALALLVAWHDLLFLQHPAAAELLLAGRRLRRVSAHAEALCRGALVPPPRPASPSDGYRDQVVARHGLLHNLWSLSRVDVHISFWAGRRHFLGQEPPARLLAWRGLRRVHEERARTLCAAQMLESEDEGARRALRALLGATPLTDLWQPRRENLGLDLGRHAAVLRVPSLARALIGHYLDLGLLEVAAPLFQAARGLLMAPSTGREADTRVALRFLSHLHLLALFDPAAGEAGEALLAHVSGAAAQREFFALYGVLCAHWPTLAWPVDLALRGDLVPRAQAYGEACRRLVTGARLDELVGLCARALLAPLPPPTLSETR